jgi:hypothetical protein
MRTVVTQMTAQVKLGHGTKISSTASNPDFEAVSGLTNL